METDRLLVGGGKHQSLYSWPAIRDEARAIWAICWKISIATFCQLSVLTISTAFLGHLGTNELAASALVISLVGGFRIIYWAFSVSISTLGGQAYGAKNFELVGVWLQIGLVVLTPVSAIIVFLHLNIRPFLLLMTQDEDLLALAVTFARYSAWSVWPNAAYEALRGYYKAQEIMTPTAVVDVASLFLALGVNYVCIYGIFGWPGFGFIGSPIANFIVSVAQPATLWCCAHLLQERSTKTWFGWSWHHCLNATRMGQFLSLTGTFFVYLALDEWVYNVCAIMAANMSNFNVAAYNILFTIWYLAYGVYIGFSTPIQVRVSHALGANDPAKAKQTSVVGFGLGGIAACLLSVVMFLFQDALLAVYTSDAALQATIRTALVPFCLAAFLSGLHITLSAMLEAMSLASMLVLTSCVGSWFVLLPTAYVLAFVADVGFPGLYWGSVVGESVKLVIMSVVLVWVYDWEAIAERISNEARSDHEHGV
ncbi:Aste57867_11418 [Aphanomyces stellatus]|uniref:Aste57867_11418 protein n=1 Tax=Aphanomyces stellatus TaxID=120398 RepID=A0A485KT94_9STRA|nr:hypothetical protein As57867_011376 [Aphanomyces stellatus]VFT88279.1 Aste57867_11418 [Aphanomyces stellatus]